MYKHKRIYNLDRRNFLQGLGSVLIPLPMFEFFLTGCGRAYAAGSPLPQRLLLMKSGNAPAWDGDQAKDITGGYRNLLTPLSFGANYQLSPALQSMNKYPGLQNYIGVFSNGRVPFGKIGSGSAGTPPGGPSGHFHECGNYPQMTGKRQYWTGESQYGFDPGPSGDQLLKQQLNPLGKYIHANYRGQSYGDKFRGSMQFDAKGNGIAPTASAKAIFLQLFSNFSAPNGMVDPAQTLAFNKRKSILDLLDKDRLNFLNRELGAKEKAMLTSHLDSIREIEKRVETLTPLPSVSGCLKPESPATEPGESFQDESKRIDMIIDLMAMAFRCDIVRHGTFRLTSDQTFLPSTSLTGKNANFHDCTHYNSVNTNNEDQIKCVSWVVEKFFKMAAALQNIQEGSGNILDNSAIVYLSEGGHGTMIDDSFPGSHSLENIVSLIAGKAGGIKTGSHIKLNGSHTVQVILSAMKAVGYTGNTIGDVSGHDTSIWNG